MHTDDFDYTLPPELIAQKPAEPRDASRLLVLDRTTGAVAHHRFAEIVDLLRPGDRLVFNDTRVVPARLFCRRPSGGNVELLFTEEIDRRTWKSLVRPGRRLKPGSKLIVKNDNGSSVLTVENILESGERAIRLTEGPDLALIDLIERCGAMPLPPYIDRAADDDDTGRYQTVYAARNGAVAAPTAGLHFTRELLDKIDARGIARTFITLHVGIGTFLPVKVGDPRDHVMHEERFEVTERAAAEIMLTKRNGGRIVAVGTTAVRVLEHCAAPSGSIEPSTGRTTLKILPPYDFKIVDALVTNFHLPKSTLLMLVSAFAGRERVLAAYDEAVRRHYRFFSYGDAMFIG
jgi:S-adenosylmethionine:tRNA ribosyltransferase-isomerase